MNKKVITSFQKMIDVNTPIIYINDYDFVRIDEIIKEIVGNSKVFEWNPATGTTNFKTKESQGLGENDTLEQFLRDKYTVDVNLKEKFLVLKDIQDFIKRLRRYLEYNQLPDIRYYAVGEYGSKTYRPHYHAIIFGYFPDDAEIVKYNSKGQHLYHSAILSKLWKHGEVMAGACSAQTMFYTASYVTGKQLGFNSYAWYDAMNIERPFAVMSRRPGIGYQYCIDHKDKILNSELLSVGIDGELSTFTAPRYFLDQFRLTHPDEYAKLKSDRLSSLFVSTKDKRFVGRDYSEKRERSDYEDKLASERYSKKRIGI